MGAQGTAQGHGGLARGRVYDSHGRRSVPGRATLYRRRQFKRHRLVEHLAGLQEKRLHLEHALGSMRLGVQPRHRLTAMQNRQHVVAVHAFFLQGVTLDAVVEIEHAGRTLPVPHDRIEG